jgi:hypothetical protein
VKKQELNEKELGTITGGARGSTEDGSASKHGGKRRRTSKFDGPILDGGSFEAPAPAAGEPPAVTKVKKISL